MATNPDLLSAGGQPTVAPIHAITKPMGNTKQEEAMYFHCTMPTASFHREDGKKLPFLHHFLKTNVKEDIAYLLREIENGNPYIRLATADEVDHAKLMEDPLGTVREAVKNELSIEELEKLLAARRAAVAAGGNDGEKIANVDPKAASVALAAKGVNVHASATGANTASVAALAKLSGK